MALGWFFGYTMATPASPAHARGQLPELKLYRMQGALQQQQNAIGQFGASSVAATAGGRAPEINT